MAVSGLAAAASPRLPFGVRAFMPDEGAQVLTDLELYLAWRAEGLPVEAPGVRR